MLVHLRIAASVVAWAVPAAVTPAAAIQTDQSAELRTIAEFFVPSTIVAKLAQGGCSVGYLTKRSANTDDQALEREIPGIQARMLAAASAFCEAEMPAAVARWHQRIITDWSELSRADRARVHELLAPTVARVDAIDVQFREGDTATSALAHSVEVDPSADATFRASLDAFSRTPGGGALLNRIFDYKAAINASLTREDNEIVRVIKGALDAAHRAANAYAREKGFENVYTR